MSYSLAKGQTLPAGLVIYDGKVYGTPKTASAEAQTVKFTVRGQNQTVAEFTLIISSVEKGIPSFTAGRRATHMPARPLRMWSFQHRQQESTCGQMEHSR